MLPENYRSGSPEDWLRYARSDLEIAHVAPSADMMLESLCFHAQQTAEKALKAVLIHVDIEFPRTHSIPRLLDLLPPDIEIPQGVQDAASLTDYAVFSRYPGDLEPVDGEEYQDAIRLAEGVLNWSEEVISNNPGNDSEEREEQAEDLEHE